MAGRIRPQQNQNIIYSPLAFQKKNYIMSTKARKFPQLRSKLENFLNYGVKIIHLISLDISKQRSTILSNELFRGNSIIISDCLVSGTSFLKSLPGCRISRHKAMYLTIILRNRAENFSRLGLRPRRLSIRRYSVRLSRIIVLLFNKLTTKQPKSL